MIMMIVIGAIIVLAWLQYQQWLLVLKIDDMRMISVYSKD